MPDTVAEDNRPWWAITRLQGVGLMCVGVVLLCYPPTSQAGLIFVSVGAGWAAGGVNAKETRKIFNGK